MSIFSVPAAATADLSGFWDFAFTPEALENLKLEVCF